MITSNDFIFCFSDFRVDATTTICKGGFALILKHSRGGSFSDLVLRKDETGTLRIFGQGGRPIKTRQGLQHYWPSGWRCL